MKKKRPKSKKSSMKSIYRLELNKKNRDKNTKGNSVKST